MAASHRAAAHAQRDGGAAGGAPRDANGWWRDTAQQLLVLKQDKSVVPALKQLARRRRTNQLARIHALWTLDGLMAADAALVRTLMKDADAADSPAGDSRERDALQGRRPLLRRRLQGPDQRRRRRRRHAGDDDDERAEGAGCGGDDQGRGVVEQGAGRADDCHHRVEPDVRAGPRQAGSTRSAWSLLAGRRGACSRRAARSTPRCASRVTARTAAASRCRARPRARRARRRSPPRRACSGIRTTSSRCCCTA